MTLVDADSVAPPGPAVGAVNPRRARWSRRALLLGVAGFVVFFGVIELLGRTSGLSEDALPRAGAILVRMGQLAVDPEYLTAAAITVQSAAIGVVIALALAVPAGVLLGSSRRAFSATNGLIELLRPIPAVAVIPPALLIFGTGMTMKLFLVVYAAFWILLYNTIYGVRDVDPVTIDSARSYGLSRRQIFARVCLPSASPHIYTGLRVAATAALLVAIGVELIGGGVDGIGRWLSEAQEAVTRRSDVYAGAFLTGVIGLAVNALLDLGERKGLAWSVRARESQS
jgi:NitT/TauT family transport system permease protein